MGGLMQWRSRSIHGTGAKELYVQHEGTWKHYSHLPKGLLVADGPVTRDTNMQRPIARSRGLETMRRLLSLGYELVPSDQALPSVALQELSQQAQTPKKMPLSGLTEDQRQRWIA